MRVKSSDTKDMMIFLLQLNSHFSAVLGTTSAYSSKVIRPSGLPPISMSKNTEGFFMDMDLDEDLRSIRRFR